MRLRNPVPPKKAENDKKQKILKKLKIYKIYNQKLLIIGGTAKKKNKIRKKKMFEEMEIHLQEMKKDELSQWTSCQVPKKRVKKLILYTLQ